MRTITIEQEKVELVSNYTGLAVTDLKRALKAAERDFGYREKAIYNDIQSIEVNSHVSPGDRYITANVYDGNGDGFQIIVKHETDRGPQYTRKAGEIVG